MKSIRIIENRSEIGAGTRGSSLGVDALKIASLKEGSDLFARLSSSTVEHQNHLLWEKNPTPQAIHIEGMIKVFESVAKEVSTTLSMNEFPLILAADHASAGGTIAGLKSANPNSRLGVIWIDAHGDLHSPFTSPSGNIHGMPLATALAEDNLANKAADPIEGTRNQWNALKELGGISPKILPEDIVFFGVRDTETPEDNLIKEKSIKNYTVEECREKGIELVCKEALSQLSSCDMIYISFDVDSMDPDLVSYGTGTPVVNGFSPSEAMKIIELLIKDNSKISCFEMVEVNPLLDNKGNKMAETAFGILKNVVKLIEEN